MRCGFSEGFEVDVLKFSPIMNSPKSFLNLKKAIKNKTNKLSFLNGEKDNLVQNTSVRVETNRFRIAVLSLLFQSLQVLLASSQLSGSKLIHFFLVPRECFFLPSRRYHAISRTLFSFGILSLSPCERETVFFSSGGSSLLFLFKMFEMFHNVCEPKMP